MMMMTSSLPDTVSEFGCNEVNNCDENADCVYNYETLQYECECKDGFSGDGLSCTETGEGKDQQQQQHQQ